MAGRKKSVRFQPTFGSETRVVTRVGHEYMCIALSKRPLVTLAKEALLVTLYTLV